MIKCIVVVHVQPHLSYFVNVLVSAVIIMCGFFLFIFRVSQFLDKSWLKIKDDDETNKDNGMDNLIYGVLDSDETAHSSGGQMKAVAKMSSLK